jgi:four helix bundle protein
MKKPSVLREKSLLFGEKIIEISRLLKEQKSEFTIHNQLLRSGTAVGALVREAEFAQSRADFINKLSVALKEANETEYWLLLLHKGGGLKSYSFEESQRLLTEIISMLVASVKTAKSHIGK